MKIEFATSLRPLSSTSFLFFFDPLPTERVAQKKCKFSGLSQVKSSLLSNVLHASKGMDMLNVCAGLYWKLICCLRN